jgi:hypothetical protein
VLVQKSVTTITNWAGRLSRLDARETLKVSQDPPGKKLALDLPAEFSGHFHRFCKDSLILPKSLPEVVRLPIDLQKQKAAGAARDVIHDVRRECWCSS